MIYTASPLAVVIFISFVALVLGISFYFARQTRSSAGYFAASGTVPWSVNGIAFAGDYLSAASFLGICGMIATAGFDGFLYSIGYLAGWVVALFVVAEPLKRLGKFTFTDALDAKFNARGIQLTAGISTLIVSLFYLIPQMVGAGDLVTPLLGLPHWAGVMIVGAIVIFIVATAGMKSTTYVQFLKGALLIIFSTILVVMVVRKGLNVNPLDDYHQFKTIPATLSGKDISGIEDDSYTFVSQHDAGGVMLAKLKATDGTFTWWKLTEKDGVPVLQEALSLTKTDKGEELYNGAPKAEKRFYTVGHLSEIVVNNKKVDKVENLGPFRYLALIQQSTVIRFAEKSFQDGGEKVTVWYQNPTKGADILKPGLKFKIDKGATPLSKLNFISLMLALFFGTSALPHVLIRYYTVPNAQAARKSTIVAIAAIGFFYILTLFLGIGAMVGGVQDVQSSNMAAPLLAKSYGTIIFAIISAIAFATILGTVSGLIVASSGAVAHDLMDRFFKMKLTDKRKVFTGKMAAIVVGGIAIILGILFKGMNVSFLVGLAFSIAASANLPAILMVLFWKKATSAGIASSIIVGIVSSIGIILFSPSMYAQYGLPTANAPIPLDNPGIISIPLSFLTIIVVSLATQKRETARKAKNADAAEKEAAKG